MEGIAGPLLKHVTQHGMAIVRTDYYLARRQRLHLGWIPKTDARFESDRLVYVLRWLSEQGITSAVILPGSPTRPALQYWITLMPVPPLRE